MLLLVMRSAATTKCRCNETCEHVTWHSLIATIQLNATTENIADCLSMTDNDLVPGCPSEQKANVKVKIINRKE